jgi:nucleoside-diphosphate-sugar epimerase
MENSETSPKLSGLLIGGSGLIGGYLLHYFKTKTPDEIDVRSPNSKKLSLRELDDITTYFKRYKPDFVINCAITAIRSDALLSYEVNYQGSINLARAALALDIPIIHISSAATLPAHYPYQFSRHLACRREPDRGRSPAIRLFIVKLCQVKAHDRNDFEAYA